MRESGKQLPEMTLPGIDDSGVDELSAQLEHIVEALCLSLKGASDETGKQMLEMIEALRQNVQTMTRLESDVNSGKARELPSDEVSQMGDYALNLLDEISTGCASKGLREQMLALHRLSIPVVSWLHRHGGRVRKLDIIVNTIASYANTLSDTQQLEALCRLIDKLIEVIEPQIQQDLEPKDPMRPWRILNINWGIVATRTHNADIMEYVFQRLIENVPADVASFFNEGMQQMEMVDYPDHVREVMQKYAQQVTGKNVLH